MIEACEFELAAENDYYCTTHKVYFKNDSDCPYKHIAELEQQLAEQAAQLEAEKIRSAAILESIDGCAGRVAELRQQLAELREVTRELANDVEAYADVDRHGRFAYPHIMAKWESDMEPVNRARALLQERSDE